MADDEKNPNIKSKVVELQRHSEKKPTGSHVVFVMKRLLLGHIISPLSIYHILDKTVCAKSIIIVIKIVDELTAHCNALSFLFLNGIQLNLTYTLRTS